MRKTIAIGGISETIVCKEVYENSLHRLQELARACLELAADLELAQSRLYYCQCGANTLPV